MSVANKYSYRVRWSEEDGEYVGTVAEMPSLSWLSSSPVEALTGISQLTEEAVSDMAASGEEPPEPLSSKRFSGKFQVRIPPELHRKLAIEAAEERVSLNRLVAARLA
ncbi:type II toxin-antitoxin system HicB family antitoxin [Raoultibacter phocaeensis]|uniref:type II toxin-antitoxin system HicB family antitoxin n=1 Tax=Raoultibacter phocaeensis TaxID=2479841 RepID=UPI001119A1CB|nr:type II toxin-antitoxin system HicB family antitoxin [Raoultibacter phocaeensis]